MTIVEAQGRAILAYLRVNEGDDWSPQLISSLNRGEYVSYDTEGSFSPRYRAFKITNTE